MTMHRLRTLRIQAGLSQKRLAEQSGIIQVEISRLENDQRRMTIEHMVKLAAALNCLPSDLVDDAHYLQSQDQTHRQAS